MILENISVTIPDVCSPAKRCNKWFHHVRHIFALLAGMAVGLMYFTRMGISLTIVDMVHPDENFNTEEYPYKFYWTNEIQQIILGSYMATYALPQVPMTKLAKYYGPRRFVSICLLVMGLSCILTPTAAHLGWQYVVVLRLINGLAASPLLPCLLEPIENWYPQATSATGLALMQFVAMSLVVITPLVSGWLSAFHWYYSFYIPGAFTISYAVLWIILARSAADECPLVSDKELSTIKGHNLPAVMNDLTPIPIKETKPYSDSPWYFILSFPAFYPIAICWILHSLTFSGYFFLQPNYFQKVMDVPIEENGIFNFVVCSGISVSMLWANPVIAFIMHRYNKSLTFARKACFAVYPFFVVGSWLYVAKYHENQIPAMFINRLFVGTSDMMIIATLMSRFGDLGLTSMAFSMMNTMSAVAVTTFTWVCGRYLDQVNGSREGWSMIMNCLSGSTTVMVFCYVFFTSSEPLRITQPDKPKVGTTEKI